MFATALGVAGKFASADRQIGVAANRNGVGRAGSLPAARRAQSDASDSIAARLRRMINWLATAMLWSGPSLVMGSTRE